MWGRLGAGATFYQVQLAQSPPGNFAASLLRRGLQSKDGGLQSLHTRWGHRGHPGGACRSGAQKTVLAESIAAGKHRGFNDIMKVAVRGRMASEEIGAPDPRITQP
jgi:hypothetical protein